MELPDMNQDDLEREAGLRKIAHPHPGQFKVVEKDTAKPPADETNIDKIWDNIHRFSEVQEYMNSMTMAQSIQLQQHEKEIQRLKDENNILTEGVEQYKREDVIVQEHYFQTRSLLECFRA